MSRHSSYPSEFDDEWPPVEPLLPSACGGGRPKRHPRRDIVTAMLYVVCTGCAWRQLPARLSALADVLLVLRAMGKAASQTADVGGEDVHRFAEVMEPAAAAIARVVQVDVGVGVEMVCGTSGRAGLRGDLQPVVSRDGVQDPLSYEARSDGPRWFPPASEGLALVGAWRNRSWCRRPRTVPNPSSSGKLTPPVAHRSSSARASSAMRNCPAVGAGRAGESAVGDHHRDISAVRGTGSAVHLVIRLDSDVGPDRGVFALHHDLGAGSGVFADHVRPGRRCRRPAVR